MTRTVEDAARMLEVMAGYDAADPITAFSAGHLPASYRASLDANGLKGARIGILTDFLGRQAIHAPVNQVMDRVVEKMTAMGATLVRVSIPGLDDLTRDLSLMTLEFQPAFNRYLAGLGPKAPIKSFSAFMTRGEFHPSLRSVFEADLREPHGTRSPEYQRQLERRAALRQAVMTVIAAHALDAILYPHQRRLVVPVGEDQTDPERCVVEQHRLPGAGVSGRILGADRECSAGRAGRDRAAGPAWSEPTLLKLAYAFEQGARVRNPPRSTPPLK
jgi:Asp-tRNA(Asn)/Glu-tRNA(Gln) amidotransferase A subunit family amidase